MNLIELDKYLKLNECSISRRSLWNILYRLEILMPNEFYDGLNSVGVITRSYALEWLKNEIESNLSNGYFGYLCLETRELCYVSKCHDKYWLLDETDCFHRLEVTDVEELIDFMYSNM